MFIVASVALAGLVAAQLTARLAKDHFAEFRGLPRMPQED